MKKWAVEMSNFFGEAEIVDVFKSKAEAAAFAGKARKSSKAVDDPADKIRYQVVPYYTEKKTPRAAAPVGRARA